MRGRRTRGLLPWLGAVLVVGITQPAAAAHRVRPRFEPTDLDLEDRGVLEVDLQLGLARSPDAWRLVMPDFEVDLGVSEWLELDVDGAYAIEGPSGGPFQLDHPAPDSLWLGAKLGFYDARSADGERAIALGMQLGPKLPTAAEAHGVGVEALGLAGLKLSRAQLVGNGGGFVEPATQRGTSARPRGLELGVDASLDLDARAVFQLVASAAYVHFFSNDRDQLTATAGGAWQLGDVLTLSLVGLTGLLPGGDRFALLLGASPKLALFARS